MLCYYFAVLFIIATNTGAVIIFIIIVVVRLVDMFVGKFETWDIQNSVQITSPCIWAGKLVV